MRYLVDRRRVTVGMVILIVAFAGLVGASLVGPDHASRGCRATDRTHTETLECVARQAGDVRLSPLRSILLSLGVASAAGATLLIASAVTRQLTLPEAARRLGIPIVHVRDFLITAGVPTRFADNQSFVDPEGISHLIARSERSGAISA